MRAGERGRNRPGWSSYRAVRGITLGIAIGAGLAAATLAGPGFAAGGAPTSGSFTAYDYGWSANGNMKATRLTIAPGGTVTFSYPVGLNQHNADFGRGPKPSGCTQTTGLSSGPTPPLPHRPTAPGWSGSCTFTAPGVYSFHCDLHTFMTGAVVVEGPGGSPFAGPPSRAVSVRPSQKGTTVRGSVKLSSAASGGRLEVDLLASAKSLGRHGSGTSRVGRLVKTAVKPGTLRFAVALDAAAKRAERKAGRLSVTVELTVTPPGRPAVSVTRRVQLKP